MTISLVTILAVEMSQISLDGLKAHKQIKRETLSALVNNDMDQDVPLTLRNRKKIGQCRALQIDF